MGIASFVIGILSLSGVCVAFIPLLNILNCITLPVAGLGVVLAFADLVRAGAPREGKGLAIAGMVLNLTALLLGGGRFLISLFTTGGIL